MLHSPHEDSNEPSDAYGDAFGLPGQTAFVARLGNTHLICDAVCPRQAVFYWRSLACGAIVHRLTKKGKRDVSTIYSRIGCLALRQWRSAYRASGWRLSAG